jgi:hypothetical protein
MTLVTKRIDLPLKTKKFSQNFVVLSGADLGCGGWWQILGFIPAMCSALTNSKRFTHYTNDTIKFKEEPLLVTSKLIVAFSLCQ